MLEKGYIQLYIGNGKGKTTAALGLTLRAVGAGLRVFFGQFLKGQECSEHHALEQFGESVDIRKYGRSQFVIGSASEEDFNLGLKGIQESCDALLGRRFDVVILDEVLTTVSLGIVQSSDLLDLIRRKPSNVELVLTGRNAPDEICETADLITEMTEVKHYFRAGVSARKGIEM